MEVKDIDKLYDLQSDWDGCGTHPVPKEAIDRTKALLELLTNKGEPKVFPSPNNDAVILEFYKSQDNYLSIEISDKDINLRWKSPILKEPIMIRNQEFECK